MLVSKLSTKRASLPGESEKVSRQLALARAFMAACHRCRRLARGAFPEYWPIWAVLAVPLSTRRTRELVADKFGSAIRIRTDARLVNTAIQIGNDHFDASYWQSKLRKRQARSPTTKGCGTSDLPKPSPNRSCVSAPKERVMGAHADGDEIPSASHAGGVGLVVRRLAGLLVGRIGQIPAVLSGHVGEGAVRNSAD
jgi:hypothetical protein